MKLRASGLTDQETPLTVDSGCPPALRPGPPVEHAWTLPRPVSSTATVGAAAGLVNRVRAGRRWAGLPPLCCDAQPHPVQAREHCGLPVTILATTTAAGLVSGIQAPLRRPAVRRAHRTAD